MDDASEWDEGEDGPDIKPVTLEEILDFYESIQADEDITVEELLRRMGRR